VQDIVAGRDEVHDGEPLLKPVMRQGRIVEAAIPPLDNQVEAAAQRVKALPERFRSLDPVDESPVVISDFLKDLQEKTLEKVTAGEKVTEG
jgi:nicotinate phosphoribosyltransferase